MRIRRSQPSVPHRARPARSRVLRALLLLVLLAALLGGGTMLGGREATQRLLSGQLPGTEEDGTRAHPGVERLPHLSLHIGAADHWTLEALRRDALATGTLNGEETPWVGGQIESAGERVPVRVRLAPGGTGTAQPEKWPLEVLAQPSEQVQPGDRAGADVRVLDMGAFTLHSPAARGYLNEWLYVEDLRRAGILAPQYRYVRLSVNGASRGVYAMQESVSQAWLEAQGRQEGVILYVDQSALWRQATEAGPTSPLPFLVHDSARIDEDSALRAQRDAALALLDAYRGRQLPPSEVFDAALMGRCLAHAHLWGARTGAAWCSEWLYYNPLSERLEPIAVAPYASLPPGTALGPAQHDDLAVMAAYVEEARRITRPAYLEDLRTATAASIETYYVALASEFASLEMELPWTRLPERQALLLRSLNAAPSQDAPQIVHAVRLAEVGNGTTHVEVGNLSPYPVRLHAVRAGGRELAVEANWVEPPGGAAGSELVHPEALPSLVLRPMQDSVPQYLSLRVPFDALQVVASVAGVDRAVTVDVRTPEPVLSLAPPVQPSPDSALAQHAFLEQTERPGFLALRPGTWDVAGDLVLPAGYGLLAGQPVTLRFERDAVLYVDGPLLFDGAEENAIRLLPQDAGWGGLIVHRAAGGEGSLLRNVLVQGASGVQRDGWGTTAGLTFYGGRITLNDCHILDISAREAVQVVRADLSVESVRFERLAGDALSGWFVQGSIHESTFSEVGGDGIRLVGSRVGAHDIAMSRIGGAAISASEGSEVGLGGLDASDVSLAVVSRDWSTVQAQDVRVAHAWTAGFAAYTETIPATRAPAAPESLAGARIDAQNVTFADDSPRAWVQAECSVTIDGESVVARDLDVDVLRSRQRAVSAMRRLDHRFGESIAFLGYELATTEIVPGEPLVFTLYWTALAALARDYTVFVHVLDADEQVAVGWDNMPAQDAYPTTRWRVGRLVEDVHVIPLPPDLPAGTYAVSFGLYYLPTGERLPLYDAAGDNVAAGRVLLDPRLRVGPAQ